MSPVRYQTHCDVAGCSDPFLSSGYCRKHYYRWHRYGDPLGKPRRKTTTERFWEKVDLNAPGGCWVWTGSKTRQGYGHFSLGGRGRVGRAHRFAYELLVGPIPAGLTIDHLCRNPPCVNPDHLEPVTRAENTRRGDFRAGVATLVSLRTHCKNGHELTPDNISWGRNGDKPFRRCRTCVLAQQRARYRSRVAPAASQE